MPEKGGDVATNEAVDAVSKLGGELPAKANRTLVPGGVVDDLVVPDVKQAADVVCQDKELGFGPVAIFGRVEEHTV